MAVLVILALLGSYIAVATLALYAIYLHGNSYALSNTVAFTAMVTMANVGVLNFRSFDQPMQRIGWLTNPWMAVATASMLGLQVMAVYAPFMQAVLHTVPLGANQWFAIILTALPIFVIAEIYKNLRATSRRQRQGTNFSRRQ